MDEPISNDSKPTVLTDGPGQMSQVVLKCPGEFVWRLMPRPRLQKDEALVRIRRIGVCGSDFNALAGRHPVYTYPRVLGHELAGEIVKVGPNQFGIEIGDRCAIEPYINCGKCGPCRKGRSNCCEQLRLYGVHVDGGMQGFLPVRCDLLHPSRSLDFDQLALVETLGIGAHAVTRSNLAKGELALVVGAGPIGLAVAEFAKIVGARVRLLECNLWRRAFAASRGIEPMSESLETLADVVFDATGSADSMAKSLEYVAYAGRLVFVGLTKSAVQVDDAILHKREITIYSSRNSYGQFRRIINLLEQKRLDVSSWITHRMSLAEVPSQLHQLPQERGLMKVVVEVNDSYE